MGFEDFRPIVSTIAPREAAYSSGNVVGGLKTLTGLAMPAILTGLTVAIGEASVAVPGTVYLYNAAPTTTFADGDAFAPVHADNKKMIAALLLPTALSLNSRSVYDLKLGGGSTMPVIPIQTVTGGLWYYYVTSGTPNFTGTSQEIALTWFFMGGV
jgi:hypothetical protein